jgi:hypothetical protein
MRTTGHDGMGRPVKLGDLDSDGTPVGFIDDGGLSWESEDERHAAVGAGVIEQALRDAGIPPEKFSLAVEEFTGQRKLIDWIGRAGP